MQHPHCPSTQEQGNLGVGNIGRFVVDVVDTVVVDTFCGINSVAFSSATVPKKKKKTELFA